MGSAAMEMDSARSASSSRPASRYRRTSACAASTSPSVSSGSRQLMASLGWPAST